ncbi:MAG: acetate kinase [Lactobacillales bacterium]|jgi:acetate kinase|nr:acetate kinase [Lactobacillales bacterium]
MSKTIAINAGSSSLKWQLYNMPQEEVIAKGIVERIGISDSIFTVKYGSEKYEVVQDIANHKIAIQMLLDALIDLKIVSDLQEITGSGHRVVQGGEFFPTAAIATEENIEKIEELAAFAPLHNPANALGIRTFKELLPNAITVAVFDTSFHATMPESSYLYALPRAYYDKHRVRKYGAHGTSHQYVAQVAAEYLGTKDAKIITCHIGSGGSITAVENGKSVDTSMGFTPLAGIAMGTRSGDIDPAILPFIMEKENLTIAEAINVLNKESGLEGLCGFSDMRDIVDNIDKPEVKAAWGVYIDRIVKYVGSYAAKLNGVDAIVFTAGVGENSNVVREAVLDSLTYLGVEYSKEKNDKARAFLTDLDQTSGTISTDASKVKVFVIPTDEEVMIARAVENLK